MDFRTPMTGWKAEIISWRLKTAQQRVGLMLPIYLLSGPVESVQNIFTYRHFSSQPQRFR